MKNFVISLESASQRRQHIQQQFSERNINFEFYNAIYPAINEQTAQNLSVRIDQCNLTNGEVSCLLSHLSLWKKAVDEQIDYVAIFEDDVILGDAITGFLNSSDWIPKDSQVLKLEKFYEKAYMRLKAKSIGSQRYLRQLTGMHLGAAGYILSLEASTYLLKLVQTQEAPVAVDHILFEDIIFNRELLVEQMVPSLCIQSDRLHPPEKAISSHLESERRKRIDAQLIALKRVKRPIIFKIKREMVRLLKQIALMLSRQSFK